VNGPGWLLRAARARAGLSLPEAALAAGIEPSAYALAEAGGRVLDGEAYGNAFAALMRLPAAQGDAREHALGQAGPQAAPVVHATADAAARDSTLDGGSSASPDSPAAAAAVPARCGAADGAPPSRRNERAWIEGAVAGGHRDAAGEAIGGETDSHAADAPLAARP
jgi:hypothetical protein